MKKLVVGLLGAAALATTVLIVRQQRQEAFDEAGLLPAGEKLPANISLERIRELGL